MVQAGLSEDTPMLRKSEVQTCGGTAFWAEGTASVEALRKWLPAVRIKAAKGLGSGLGQRRLAVTSLTSRRACFFP